MEREFKVTPVITREDNPEISLSVIDLKGVGDHVLNLNTTAVYLCVKGVVTFAVGSDNNLNFVTLNPGHKIKINPNTPYLDFSEKGTTLLAINKRAFNEQEVVKLPVSDLLMEGINKGIATQRFRRILA